MSALCQPDDPFVAREPDTRRLTDSRSSSPTGSALRPRSAQNRPIRIALRRRRSTSRPRLLGQTPGAQPPIPRSGPPRPCGRNPRTASRMPRSLSIPLLSHKRDIRAPFLALCGAQVLGRRTGGEVQRAVLCCRLIERPALRNRRTRTGSPSGSPGEEIASACRERALPRCLAEPSEFRCSSPCGFHRRGQQSDLLKPQDGSPLADSGGRSAAQSAQTLCAQTLCAPEVCAPTKRVSKASLRK
jgi:hypothetical protein